MIEMFPDLLRGTTTGIFVVMIMFVLAQPKFNTKKTIIVMLFLIILDFSRNLWCYLHNDYTLLAKLDLLFLAVIFVFAKPFFKETVMQWIFNCVTTVNIYASVVFISYWLCDFFPFPIYANVVLRLIMFTGILFILHRFGRPLYRQVKKYWYIFILPVAGVFVNFAWLFISCDDVEVMLTDNVVELTILVIIAVGVYLSTFYSLKVTSQQYALREENLKNNAREQLLQLELISYEEAVSVAKQNRHDIRHHNALILEYLECGDIDKAKEYLNEQNEDFKETALREFCKNPVANAILRVYERRARSSNITFAVVCDISQNLPLTAPELGAMLSNILENALEACEKSKFSDKHIALRTETDEERLLIELRNTISAETQFEDGIPLSQKENGGTGTKSVAEIVNRHKGMVSFSQEKDEFFTRIVLPLN